MVSTSTPRERRLRARSEHDSHMTYLLQMVVHDTDSAVGYFVAGLRVGFPPYEVATQLDGIAELGRQRGTNVEEKVNDLRHRLFLHGYVV